MPLLRAADPVSGGPVTGGAVVHRAADEPGALHAVALGGTGWPQHSPRQVGAGRGYSDRDPDSRT